MKKLFLDRIPSVHWLAIAALQARLHPEPSEPFGCVFVRGDRLLTLGCSIEECVAQAARHGISLQASDLHCWPTPPHGETAVELLSSLDVYRFHHPCPDWIPLPERLKKPVAEAKAFLASNSIAGISIPAHPNFPLPPPQ